MKRNQSLLAMYANHANDNHETEREKRVSTKPKHKNYQDQKPIYNAADADADAAQNPQGNIKRTMM